MALTKQELIQLYRKRAQRYDLTANLYYLIGFRENAYRQKAVSALALEPGDTVVELGCGTGLNFPYLQQVVGPEGTIIGVDLTDEMLSQARMRVEAAGWTNVRLVQSDAAAYDYPSRVDGVLSTFALTLVPEYDEVIRKGGFALAPGGRLAILDFKKPEGMPAWLIQFMVLITRPFGVTLDLAERHLWESVRTCFDESSMEEFFLGFAYLAVGTAPAQQRASLDEPAG